MWKQERNCYVEAGEKKLLSWRQEKKLMCGGRKRKCYTEAGKEIVTRRHEKKLLHGGRRKEIAVVEAGEKKLMCGDRKRNCCRGGRRKNLLRGGRKRNCYMEAGEKKLLCGGRKRNCFTESGEKKLLCGEGRRKDIVVRNRGKKIVENNRIGPERVIAVEGDGGCDHKEFCREPINLLNVNTLCWVACRLFHDT